MSTVNLLWRTSDGIVVSEVCELVSDDDEIFLGGHQVSIITDKGKCNTVGSVFGNMVMFEDEEGLFGIDPSDIIEIKAVHG